MEPISFDYYLFLTEHLGISYTGEVLMEDGSVAYALPMVVVTAPKHLWQKNPPRYVSYNESMHQVTAMNTLEVEVSAAEKILSGGMGAALLVSQLDSPIPGPGDVAGAVIAVGTLLVAGIVWLFSPGKKEQDRRDRRAQQEAAEKTISHQKMLDNNIGNSFPPPNNNMTNKQKIIFVILGLSQVIYENRKFVEDLLKANEEQRINSVSLKDSILILNRKINE